MIDITQNQKSLIVAAPTAYARINREKARQVGIPYSETNTPRRKAWQGYENVANRCLTLAGRIGHSSP